MYDGGFGFSPAAAGWIATKRTQPETAGQCRCGPNPERQAQCIHAELEAGYDEVHVNQFGSDWTGYFDFFGKKVRPRLGA
ncbi:MAG TPA: hypothetical protein VFC03_03915 [Acidimicrobiales bacterium]|nr:hypothetical protein [Acidimicrobiales bacterium]